MTSRPINAALLYHELEFTASRSSGPGGQNVNKVNSKISVRFDVIRSNILTEAEKSTLLRKLSSHLTKDGVLMLSAQDKRSQLENKDAVIEKMERLIAKAFEVRKARRASKPSKSSVEKRITKKKVHSEKKQWRQKPDL